MTGDATDGSTRSRFLRSLWGRVVDAGLSLNASAVAYNAFLALVPLGAGLLGIAAVFGQDHRALESITSSLAVVAPPDVVVFVEDLLVEVGDRVGGSQGWLIAGSVALSLLFGSRAVAALQKALASVEDRTEARRGLQLRAVAVGLTVAGGGALAVTSLMLIAGRRAISFLAEWSGAGWVEWTWVWLRLPIALAGLFAFLLAFYRWGPPQPLPRSWLAAVVGSAGTILASLGFGLYLEVSPSLGTTFGVLGAVAVALVWLYVCTMALLLGAVVVAHVSRVRTEAAGGVAERRIIHERPDAGRVRP